MKKFFYIAGMCLAVSLTSCEDFLTVQSPDEMDYSNFWTNKENAEAGLAAAYSQLYHGDTYATSEVRWPTEEYRADLFGLGSDAGNYDSWVQLYYFNYTNGNAQFSYYYKDLYRGINFANQVLEYTPNIPVDADHFTEAEHKEILSEAHFLRGYYHMMLLLNWEKIIIRDGYISDPEQQEKALSERADCWKFIIDELNYATALPEKREAGELGRATCGAAYAYLGFAYLTRAWEEQDKKAEYLQEAKEALEKVNKNNIYGLVEGEDLVNMFNGKNPNSQESIFEVQYSPSEASGSVHYSYIHHWIAAKEMGGYDEIIPSDILVNTYKSKKQLADNTKYDQRMYNTLYFNGGELVFNQYPFERVFAKLEIDADTKDTVKVYPLTEEQKNRVVFRKFTVSTQAEMSSSCAINIPLMRYANVLLMQAEVMNELNKPDEAAQYINQVRTKHGKLASLPSTGNKKADIMKEIEYERIVEFPLESYRWYDIRRWGVTAERLKAANRTGYTKGEHDFYPIPMWELNTNSLVK